jgi:hypothetical protein
VYARYGSFNPSLIRGSQKLSADVSFLSHLLFSIGIVPSVYSCYSSVL